MAIVMLAAAIIADYTQGSAIGISHDHSMAADSLAYATKVVERITCMKLSGNVQCSSLLALFVCPEQRRHHTRGAGLHARTELDQGARRRPTTKDH